MNKNYTFIVFFMSNASMLNVYRSKKWYEGPNVCIERKVIQDGDEVEEGNVFN